MKLNDYIDMTKCEVERFNKWYRKQHEKTPNRFPLEMDASDWMEQFIIFMTGIIDDS